MEGITISGHYVMDWSHSPCLPLFTVVCPKVEQVAWVWLNAQDFHWNKLRKLYCLNKVTSEILYAPVRFGSLDRFVGFHSCFGPTDIIYFHSINRVRAVLALEGTEASERGLCPLLGRGGSAHFSSHLAFSLCLCSWILPVTSAVWGSYFLCSVQF